MDSNWEADGLFKARSANLSRYKRNFLRQVVCEFRFPTLMELGGDRPPASFANALRKQYPTLELGNELTLGLGVGATGTSRSHIFRSPKQDWVVSLKQSSFSLETTAYSTFEELQQRALHVVDAAVKIIDADFFTRVGLRYINTIDREEDPADGWVNSELVMPIRSQQFTGIQEYAGRLHIAASDGGCLLQHGIRLKPKQDDKDVQPEYSLDIDAYRNQVPVGDAANAMGAIHSQAFDVFDWALGDKSRHYLSEDKR